MSSRFVRAPTATKAPRLSRPLRLHTLGRCPSCMRQAFAGAVMAWAMVGLSQLVWPAAEPACILMAAMITGLWVAHILARAFTHANCATCAGSSGAVDAARRHALPEFLQFLAVAILVGTPSFARAQPCKCYCGGTSWSPGATACMGGFRYVCNAKSETGQCGWDPLGGPNNRCTGGEHCS